MTGEFESKVLRQEIFTLNNRTAEMEEALGAGIAGLVKEEFDSLPGDTLVLDVGVRLTGQKGLTEPDKEVILDALIGFVGFTNGFDSSMTLGEARKANMSDFLRQCNHTTRSFVIKLFDHGL